MGDGALSWEAARGAKMGWDPVGQASGTATCGGLMRTAIHTLAWPSAQSNQSCTSWALVVNEWPRVRCFTDADSCIADAAIESTM